ncbi:MAG: hypothetical protein QOE97_2657 [Pseudonocardiales bacterium]|nr:hypothetical protein [Pseudonocardiales bacterium]
MAARRTSFVLASAVAALVAALFPPSASAGPTASIAGTVRVAGTGGPAPGVAVLVVKLGTAGGPSGPIQGPIPVATATTGADGSYRVDGLAPSGAFGYWLCFDPGFLSSLDGQCWVNQPGFVDFPNPFGFVQVPAGSATIVVTSGQRVASIDASLVDRSDTVPTGAIAGTAVDSTVRHPLRNVRVTVWDGANHVVGNDVTGADGTYLVDHLYASASGYRVCFDGSSARGGFTLHAFDRRCYARAPWSGTSAPPAGAISVPVVAGATADGTDVTLSATLL